MAIPDEMIERLNWRCAVKQFDPAKKLDAAQVEYLKDVLRLVPSAFGLQLWKFLFIKDAKLREALVGKSWGQGQIKDAAELVVMCRPETVGEAQVDKFIAATVKTRGRDSAPLKAYVDMMKGFLRTLSEEQKGVWMEKQVYIALGQLLTAAAAAGIDACPMEGFDKAAYDEMLGLEAKGLRSVVLCALGFRAESDKYAKAAKVRYSKEEIFATV